MTPELVRSFRRAIGYGLLISFVFAGIPNIACLAHLLFATPLFLRTFLGLLAIYGGLWIGLFLFSWATGWLQLIWLGRQLERSGITRILEWPWRVIRHIPPTFFLTVWLLLALPLLVLMFVPSFLNLALLSRWQLLVRTVTTAGYFFVFCIIVPALATRVPGSILLFFVDCERLKRNRIFNEDPDENLLQSGFFWGAAISVGIVLLLRMVLCGGQ